MRRRGAAAAVHADAERGPAFRVRRDALTDRVADPLSFKAADVAAHAHSDLHAPSYGSANVVTFLAAVVSAVAPANARADLSAHRDTDALSDDVAADVAADGRSDRTADDGRTDRSPNSSAHATPDEATIERTVRRAYVAAERCPDDKCTVRAAVSRAEPRPHGHVHALDTTDTTTIALSYDGRAHDAADAIAVTRSYDGRAIPGADAAAVALSIDGRADDRSAVARAIDEFRADAGTLDRGAVALPQRGAVGLADRAAAAARGGARRGVATAALEFYCAGGPRGRRADGPRCVVRAEEVRSAADRPHPERRRVQDAVAPGTAAAGHAAPRLR